ncbi:MAG TPA: DNA polymerase, partial [Thermoleophilaceae bacterium]|nr:DNA polymerase [Thermoleophilaceae bacterium]
MSKEIFLIDGNSLAYRAFFALPETIATSRGFPTNAIFGFASMLVKILTEYGPKPTLVVWDAGMSGREKQYEEYKAGRRKKPDLLREQWPHLAPLVEAFGYTNVSAEGFEADDVIATLARRAREAGMEVMVVTGDRDALQLVEEGVRVMATARGITETKLYDREAVIERYGIPPELIPDFYGLKGDTSDNIPGVPGIGDKTAAQLLQRFGDLETVLASVDEVSGAKRKENLAVHAEAARISKLLATAQREVELDIDLAACAAREPDRSRLREVFREFELRDPLRRLEEALGDEDEAVPREHAETSVSLRAVEGGPERLAALEGELAALAAGREANREPGDEQLELGALEPADLPLRFAGYAGGGEVLAGEAATLGEIAAGWGDRPLVVHDWKTLAAAEEDCPAPALAHDTMVAAYLIDPARRGYPLDELAEAEGLGAEIEGGDVIARRAVLTRLVAERQVARLEEDGLASLLHDVELPLVDVLVEMQRAGVRLDTERLAGIREQIVERTLALERDIHRVAGEEFTIGSPQQLAHVLFEKLGLSRKRRGKTGFSTDARVLQAIRHEHEIVPMIE